jgi:uroporphyrinogen-III decarboxylase
MNSRERFLAAIRRQPVDHVPLYLRFWPLNEQVDDIPFNWRDEVCRVENTLALGLDDTFLLQPPLGYVEDYRAEGLPGVESYTHLSPPEQGDGYPRLKKIYETPEGPLQTVVKVTEDWPNGEEILLFDDHNVPRMDEPLVKTAKDLPKLAHLLQMPTPEQMLAFERKAEWSRVEQMQVFERKAVWVKEQAQRLGVALDGGWSALGDTAVWLCGMERILYGQMDDPAFLEALLDIVLEWELRRMDRVLEKGVDCWVHMAWYEGSDFWSPKNYRKLLKPRLQKIIDKAHDHGALFRYIITKGWKPLRRDFIEMGIDCIMGVDPVQDQVVLEEIKEEIGSELCLMGGVNSGVMLSEWDDDRICEAVVNAVRTLAPGGGFILYPVDAIFNTQPWGKVQTLIETWRKSNLS